jgi:ribose transport system permease protein
VQIAGVPLLAICVIVLAGRHGRRAQPHHLRPLGDGHRPEHSRAADLAGIRVERIRFFTYVMSAVLAALCGYLFSGFSGGSSLSMGEQYLLASIAVVVIGGTSVAGGNGNVPGLWGAALFCSSSSRC